jgi:hypothetical protein
MEICEKRSAGQILAEVSLVGAHERDRHINWSGHTQAVDGPSETVATAFKRTFSMLASTAWAKWACQDQWLGKIEFRLGKL